MELTQTYPALRRAVVAFIPNWVPRDRATGVSPYPPIIGTGFIADSDGLVVTNQHVVDALKKLPVPEGEECDRIPANALLYTLGDGGQLEVPLPVLSSASIGAVTGGPGLPGVKPDLSVVHVDATGLPVADLDADCEIVEGMELATAGFPMGTDALTAPGWLHQVTPTLQRGIVSAVLPFPGSALVGFTLNVMVQGGASGSPVFNPDTGRVVGVLHASLVDSCQTEEGKRVTLPTNISYVVPAYVMRDMLQTIRRDGKMLPRPDTKSLEETIATGQRVDRYEDMGLGRLREVRKD